MDPLYCIIVLLWWAYHHCIPSTTVNVMIFSQQRRTTIRAPPSHCIATIHDMYYSNTVQYEYRKYLESQDYVCIFC